MKRVDEGRENTGNIEFSGLLVVLKRYWQVYL